MTVPARTVIAAYARSLVRSVAECPLDAMRQTTILRALAALADGADDTALSLLASLSGETADDIRKEYDPFATRGGDGC